MHKSKPGIVNVKELSKMDKMLFLDCRQAENLIKLESILKNLKPLKPYSESDITVEQLESLITKLHRKTKLAKISYIMPTFTKEELYYSASVLNTQANLKSKHVYARSLWELYAKIAIYMYQIVKEETKGED